MILLFLRDLRSVIVVVSNIPLALLGSLFGLWLTGNTINIMSLGGMALAIGILVDEATVEVENVTSTDGTDRQCRHGGVARQSHHSRAAVVGLAMYFVCVHPSLHHGRSTAVSLYAADLGRLLRYDFLVSALQHSYVPIMCVALLKHTGHTEGGRSRRAVRQNPLRLSASS